MSHDFDAVLGEYEQKLKQSIQITNELNTLLKSMSKFLTVKENVIKLDIVRKKHVSNNEADTIVDFNVGGTLFSTLKSNLTKKLVKLNAPKGGEFYEPHMLQSLVNGVIPDVRRDKKDAIFIDRDPKYFGYILNYLRAANTSEKFECPNKIYVQDGLLKEAEFYHMQGLIDMFNIFSGSLILDTKQSQSLLKLCEFSPKDKWALIYRGSSHGFGSGDFHAKCDGIKNTITIVKSANSCIFGGFTANTWDSSGQSKLDSSAFVFSFVNKDNKPVKMMFDPSSGSYSIQCYSTFGPTFGGGHDFHVADRANTNSTSYSNLGHTYKHPHYVQNSNEAKSFLGGAYNFQISEIEVYTKV